MIIQLNEMKFEKLFAKELKTLFGTSGLVEFCDH